jgi:NTP pyrophosphatase (non-canonical NTP hydrolase)
LAHHCEMKMITGRVIGGRIEVPEEFADEGAQVVILALETGEPIQLSLEEEKELWEAREDIRRGDYVDGETLLSELRSLRS